jgi:hypothetical protein
MKKKVTLGLVIVVAVISFSTVFVTNAEEPEKPEVNSAEQSGDKQKIYAVYVKSASFQEESYVLQPLDEISFKGIKCLTGTYARSGYWTSGKKIYIPVDSVNHIIEFDSLESYEKAVGKYTEKQMKKIGDYYQPGR